MNFKSDAALQEKTELKEKLQWKEFEFTVTSEKEIQNAETKLKTVLDDEAAEQYVFALKATLTECFVNQCQDATKSFAKNLATRFGGEESFFDLSLQADFFDLRSNGGLEKIGYRGNYHSVSMIRIGNDNNTNIICDLTYGNIAGDGRRNNILLLKVEGDVDRVSQVLKERYGGSWHLELAFDKEKNIFKYID